MLEEGNYAYSMCDICSVLHFSILAFTLPKIVEILAYTLNFPSKESKMHAQASHSSVQPHMAMVSILKIDFWGTSYLHCSMDAPTGVLIVNDYEINYFGNIISDI